MSSRYHYRHRRTRPPFRHLVCAAKLLLAVLLAACQHDLGAPLEVSSPASLAIPTKKTAVPTQHMIAAAHPLAAEVGRDILRRGGGALDAAIAAQMVLSLVEPQSSGIGGGAFLLHYAAKTGAIDSYDGRETAPASALPNMFLKPDGKPRKFFDAVVGGLSVGVPGVIRMLEMAHREHGRMTWWELFQPAIQLAEKGFVKRRGAKGLRKNNLVELALRFSVDLAAND